MTDTQKKNPDTKPRKISGKVVSVKMIKSVVVEVQRMVRHPIYKKALRRGKRFLAHNEIENLAVGDTVRMIETKPQSKNKHYGVLGQIKHESK